MTEKIYNILLVENDEVDVMSIQRTFRKHDIQHNITVAENGLAALQQLEEWCVAPHFKKPHLILLDINMPKMNGLDFLRELRSRPAFMEVPVYVLTTSDDAGDKASAYQYHISGYIVKPINGNEFENAILQLNRYWEMIEFPD